MTIGPPRPTNSHRGGKLSRSRRVGWPISARIHCLPAAIHTHMKTSLLRLAAVALFGISFAGRAEASVAFSVSGNSITLTNDTPFTFIVPASGSGSAFGFVIEDAFLTPPSPDFLSSTGTGSMTLSVNGTTYSTGSSFTGGYANVTQGAYDSNDYVFGFSGSLINFTGGDVFTLSVGTFTYTGSSVPKIPNFAASTITLTDSVITSMGVANVIINGTVPEPGVCALVLGSLGLLGLGQRLRRG